MGEKGPHLILEVGKPLVIEKGIMSKLHRALFAGIHLGWEMHTHMGGYWNIPNMNSEPDKSKWLAKGNPEEMSHKSDSNCHEGVTLSEPTLVPTHKVLDSFPPNRHFVSLLSFFVGILFYSWKARSLSLTTSLVARIQLSLPWPNLSLWLGTEALLQATTG